jgi:hypothetical protein
LFFCLGDRLASRVELVLVLFLGIQRLGAHRARMVVFLACHAVAPNAHAATRADGRREASEQRPHHARLL